MTSYNTVKKNDVWLKIIQIKLCQIVHKSDELEARKMF